MVEFFRDCTVKTYQTLYVHCINEYFDMVENDYNNSFKKRKQCENLRLDFNSRLKSYFNDRIHTIKKWEKLEKDYRNCIRSMNNQGLNSNYYCIKHGSDFPYIPKQLYQIEKRDNRLEKAMYDSKYFKALKPSLYHYYNMDIN
jgi:hypothetical protein